MDKYIYSNLHLPFNSPYINIIRYISERATFEENIFIYIWNPFSLLYY